MNSMVKDRIIISDIIFIKHEFLIDCVALSFCVDIFSYCLQSKRYIRMVTDYILNLTPSLRSNAQLIQLKNLSH